MTRAHAKYVTRILVFVVLLVASTDATGQVDPVRSLEMQKSMLEQSLKTYLRAMEDPANGDSKKELEKQLVHVKEDLAVVQAKLTELQSDIRVYALLNTSSVDAAELLKTLFGELPRLRIGIDTKANRLLVSATADQHRTIEAILLKLDSVQAEANEKTKDAPFHRIVMIEPDFLQTATLLADRYDEIQIAGTNMTEKGLDVMFTSTDNKTFVDFLSQIELSQERWQPVARRVRIIWLTTDASQESKSPEVLSKVIEKVVNNLEKIGAGKMKFVSQLFVTTQDKFESANVLEDGILLSAEGSVGTKDLSVKIVVKAGSSDTAEVLASLSAKVPIREGHPVVLGMNQTAETNSAFVLIVD